MPATAAFRAEIDPLSYPARMRLLAVRARELPGLAAALSAGNAFERFLGATAAAITGDEATATGLLGDPDPAVRSAAVKICLRAGWLAGDDLAALLADAPADLRRLIYGSLRVMRRTAGADFVIDIVRERYGDTEAVAVLPACGPLTVRRLLPELAYAVRGWSVLGRRHGAEVLEHAEAVFSSTGGVDLPAAWVALGSGVFSAAALFPERVLDLLERFAPGGALPGLHIYGALAAVAPQRVVRLLIAPGREGLPARGTLPSSVLERLAGGDLLDLVALGRLVRGEQYTFARLLRALPPSRRGTFFDAVMIDVDTTQAPPGPVLEVLPRQWRHREARHLLRLPEVRDNELAVLAWSAYLPWPEADPVLTTALRSRAADQRAVAYRSLVTAARFSADPAVAADVIGRLGRLRNEQDPVRAAALNRLSGLTPFLRAESIDALDRLVTDAVEARDVSARSLHALGRLAARVLAEHHDDPALLRWALHTLDRLPAVPELTGLRHGQETLVFDRLRDWIEAGTERGNFDRLFAVARALGPRARHLAGLQTLLRRAIDPGTVPSVAQEAIALWLDDPRTRADRVAEVLAADASTVELRVVWRTLCGRRTDLLDRFLTGPPPTGRFISAGQRRTTRPPVFVRRWLPRQHEALAAQLADVVADAGTPLPDRVAALSQAATIPAAGVTLARRYTDSANVNLAEAALAALARTDRPDEALPILLSRAGDDRARAALYAAGHAARFARPSTLLTALSATALGAGKVTSRKEALRLLAAYGPPEAVDVLAAVHKQHGVHPDVQAAAVFGARSRLHQEPAWTILTEAAHGTHAEVTEVVAARPSHLAGSHRPRYATLVVAACTSADHLASRAGWSALPAWIRWAPDTTDLVVAELTDLSDTQSSPGDDWPTLVPLIGELIDHPPRPDATVLEAVLRDLVRLDTADPDPAARADRLSPAAVTNRQPAAEAAAGSHPAGLEGAAAVPGGPARDRPARRRVGAVVRAAEEWARQTGPEADREPVRRAARDLGRHQRFVPDAARLLTTLIDPGHPVLGELSLVADLVAGRPVLAARLADQFATRIRVTHPSVLLPAGRDLAARGDAAAGFFALACIRAGAAFGWTAPWREQLENLRAHPDQDVSDAAYEVIMEGTGTTRADRRSATRPVGS